MNEEVKKEIELLKKSTMALALELPATVWEHHKTIVDNALAVLEKALDKPAPTANEGMKEWETLEWYIKATALDGSKEAQKNIVALCDSVRSSLQSAAEFRKRVEDELNHWQNLAEENKDFLGEKGFVTTAEKIAKVLTDLLGGK